MFPAPSPYNKTLVLWIYYRPKLGFVTDPVKLLRHSRPNPYTMLQGGTPNTFILGTSCTWQGKCLKENSRMLSREEVARH